MIEPFDVLGITIPSTTKNDFVAYDGIDKVKIFVLVVQKKYQASTSVLTCMERSRRPLFPNMLPSLLGNNYEFCKNNEV